MTGDDKSKYSTTVSKMKKITDSNKSLNKKLNAGMKRAEKYKKEWKSVNINDVVNRFAPEAKHYESNGKVIFSNNGRYCIVADVAGGYLRIKDTYHLGNVYVTLDGRYVDDFNNRNDFNKYSHYRILKRGEM